MKIIIDNTMLENMSGQMFAAKAVAFLKTENLRLRIANFYHIALITMWFIQENTSLEIFRLLNIQITKAEFQILN